MLVVSGLIEVAEDCCAKAQQAAIEMAQATREEDGCLSYAFYSDLEAPNRFRIFEEWTDGAALARHFQMPHMAVFQQALAGAKVLSREVKRYEVSAVEPLG